MRLEVLDDAELVARRGAALIATTIREAVAARGRALLALSGGTTPWRMLALLAAEEVPWREVYVFQVDERVAPRGDAARNLTHLEAALVHTGLLSPTQLHAMPVEAPELEAAAARYATELQAVAGAPAVLDLVHLGLGADGHTASLVPGDAALAVVGVDVVVAGTYQGRRRMTVTLPLINRARRVLFVVTGGDKALALQRLVTAEASIPAARVSQEAAWLLADRLAAARLG